MKKLIILSSLLVLILLVSGGCAQKPQIANPASVYCEQNGGKLEIRTNTDGSQSGYCKFDNGKECEEWAFYRKECTKELSIEESPPINSKTYELYIKGTTRDDTNALCTITSKLTNIDKATHRYFVNSSITLNGIETDSYGEEFNLEAGKFRFVSASFECPDKTEYVLNTEAFER